MRILYTIYGIVFLGEAGINGYAVLGIQQLFIATPVTWKQAWLVSKHEETNIV